MRLEIFSFFIRSFIRSIIIYHGAMKRNDKRNVVILKLPFFKRDVRSCKGIHALGADSWSAPKLQMSFPEYHVTPKKKGSQNCK